MKIKLDLSKEKKRLLTNFFSLGVLQCANYILPLLIMPYLIRVLGLDCFGLLAFAMATVMYFALISDYGFNLSATRQISIYRDDKNKVNEIFSSVMIIKFLMLIICFIALIFLVTLIDKFSTNWKIYIVSFGVVLGQTLFPVWLFQGIEQMKYITYVSISIKTFFTICIFAFVNDKSDYLLVPFFTALGSIIAWLWALFFILRKLNYKFSWQSLGTLKFYLEDGWHIFYSSMAISLYTISTTFILGLLTSNSIVGQFSAVDKIIQAVKGVYQPVAQSIYPMVGKKLHENRELGLHFINKIKRVVASVMFLLSSGLYFFSEEIIYLIFGNQFTDAANLLRIMAPLPLLVALSNIYGVQIILNLGLEKVFSRILSLAATFGLILNFLLVPLYQSEGAAYTLLVVEIFVTMTMYLYLKNYLKS